MAQALIVIDIQEGLVNENPYDAKNLIANTKALIKNFRDQNIEVIFIRHSEDEGLLATGSDNWQVYHELKTQENEKIFNKYYNSIFKNSGLKEYLDSKSITNLTFVGMQVEFCIDTSVKVGFEYGYKHPSICRSNLIFLQRKNLAKSICAAKNNKRNPSN